jgi:hypothetical protein
MSYQGQGKKERLSWILGDPEAIFRLQPVRRRRSGCLRDFLRCLNAWLWPTYVLKTFVISVRVWHNFFGFNSLYFNGLSWLNTTMTWVSWDFFPISDIHNGMNIGKRFWMSHEPPQKIQ